MGQPRYGPMGIRGTPWLGRGSPRSTAHSSKTGQTNNKMMTLCHPVHRANFSCHNSEGPFVSDPKDKSSCVHTRPDQLSLTTLLLCRYGLQLALNLAWTPLFFGKRDPGAALVDITGAFLALPS